MESKDGAAASTQPSYEDFKLSIKELKEETLVLEIDVRGFKKENLDVKLKSDMNLVEIHGERPLGGNRWQRFTSGFSVPKNSKISDFNAKLTNGVLRIAFPKTVTEALPMPTKPHDHELQDLADHSDHTHDHHKPAEVSADDKLLSANHTYKQSEGGSMAETMGKLKSSDINGSMRALAADDISSSKQLVEMLKSRPRLMVSAAVAMVVVSSLGAYAAYLVCQEIKERNNK